MTAKDLEIVYTIKPFMYEIGIKNSTRIVYAILYAFTNGKSGMYYGSRKYLYNTALVCRRTLERALSELFKKGLIEHCESEDGRLRGIRCVDLDIVKARQAAEAEAEEMARLEAQKAENAKKNPHSVWTDERREAAYTRVINRELGVLTPDEKRLALEEYMAKGIHPKYTFLHLGREGRVRMTESQYKILASLVDAEHLHNYIMRLEKMLIKNEETGLSCNTGHYRLIKEWIGKDMHV